MDVIVNGERREIPPQTTVEEVVRTLTQAPSGVAVALNDEVVPKAGWGTTEVGEADRIDVLTAVQGG
ncbi:sulfur carrier protein ThiS [Streptomonospora sediminis]